MIIALDVDGVVVNTAKEFEQSMDVTYWKQIDLYDNRQPHKDIEAIIDALNKKAEVHFVSTCYAEHYWSKYKFLKKYFPKTPFHNLDDKGAFPADLLIDDRQEVIANFLSKQKGMAMLTSYGKTFDDLKKAGYV